MRRRGRCALRGFEASQDLTLLARVDARLATCLRFLVHAGCLQDTYLVAFAAWLELALATLNKV